MIDGESITLVSRGGKMSASYDYHAYKNKVLINYPESIFDFQLVYEGDVFSFKKESGKVIYSHTISDPFSNEKKLIGAYGVIKNSKGEFIEHLNMNAIDKMRKTSNMKSIWAAWEDRMVLKSIIKRICSVHFHDIVVEIEKIDNEQYEPERASIKQLVLDEIDNCKNIDQLQKIYKANYKSLETAEERKDFNRIVSLQKKIIEEGLSS